MSADFYGKNLLITGASEQLGKTLSRRLLQDGYKISVLARDPQKVLHLAQAGARVIKGDLRDRSTLQEAVRGCHFVFHLAGAADERAPKSHFKQVTVAGTRNLAEAALHAGIERFVHVSCAKVYGIPREGTIDEFTPLQFSGDAYMDSKVQAELVLRKMADGSGLPLVIAQPSMIYGPGMETWTKQPLRKIAAKKMVLPDGGAGLLHPLYLDDAADGILSVALSGESGQAYILCGPDVVTTADFFAHYARMLGSDGIPTISADQALREATLAEWISKLTGQPPQKTRKEVQALMMRSSCNGGKAYYDLHFIPAVQLEEGMRRVKDWLRKQIATQKQPSTANVPS
jgi:nucleoside-diphosphate-sugar epimerase